MRYVFLCVWMFVHVVSGKASEVITDTIPPSKDSHVDAIAPDSNFGSAETLSLEYTTCPTKTILIKFDMPFPSQSLDSIVVDEARIGLYVYSSTDSCEVMVSALGQNWQEMEVTYNNRPGPGSSMGVSSSLTDQPGWQYINVAPFVQAFALNFLSNYGFEIMPLSTVEIEAVSGQCPDTAFRPRLYLAYHYEGSHAAEGYLFEPVEFDVSSISLKEASIKYSIPGKTQVHLEIYDESGESVGEVLEYPTTSGRYETRWRAPGPGVYFVRLEACGSVLVDKAVILR
ncbi:DNRLRE domain-containing protein [candidate division WOR-3 bacterium]|nr:DNRLRE domain-containing protein [candidate division WOR-3 bacterium]